VYLRKTNTVLRLVLAILLSAILDLVLYLYLTVNVLGLGKYILDITLCLYC